ncbi:MAG: enoyl-CoA hydratase/isomerase family protein [Bdellovibrionaceae bacterium]|nr:enoyl-CoA hydratase/isomerase family protein [Pseudobdellovibrionaceae bacterium]
MSIQESLKITPKGEVALLEWDHIGEKVNKLSTPIMMRLKEILGDLQKSSYKAVVIISRKPKIFIAGADIEEIKNLKSKDDFKFAVESGQGIMNMIEDLPIPVIAAIHGACAGGGCEMILACDYRIASDDKSTKIGLPETKLGILPGFGGSVRLPRVIGPIAAMDIILAGKLVPAVKALKVGLVDQVVHPSILEAEALKLAQKVIKEGGRKRQLKYKPKGIVDTFMNSPLGLPIVFSKAKSAVMAQSHGHYPAPLEALDVIHKTYGKSRDRAMQLECEGFCNIAGGEVSRNLVSLFFMMEAVKRRTGVSDPNVKPLPVSNIGVLGAGTMGGGIAFVAADNNVHVKMKDINNDAISKGFQAARSIYGKMLKRKRVTKYDVAEKMGYITGNTSYSGFPSLDVVIEAIVENMEVKKKVIAETYKNCKEDVIIATNTSSLSVTEMAEACPRPENFIGMHFFNPVDKMPLVEVIRGPKTSDVTTATIFELSKRMGKTPVVVKDGVGFLVNRLLIPYLIEAAFFLQEGMDIEKVDDVFVKQFGMPMGPFHLMDEVGIDVCVKVSKIFKKTIGERLQLPDTLMKLEDSDRMGKKNFKGFYKWSSDGKKQEVDSSIYSELGLSSPTNPLSDDELIGRAMYNMVNEAALVLIEERIVETAEEVDLGMIMGTGFPPFRGGLLRFADSVGSEKIVDSLELYSKKYGHRFKPSHPLRNMAKTQRKFY